MTTRSAGQQLKQRYWALRETCSQGAAVTRLFFVESSVQALCWIGTGAAALRIAVRRRMENARQPGHRDERRFILVSYYSPSYKSLWGTQRWSKALKYLCRAGWQATLVTTTPPPEEADPAPEPLPDTVRVVRAAGSVFRHPWFASRGRAVPDSHVPWAFAAYRATLAAAKETAPSVIVATVPPYSNLTGAVMASAKLGLPLLADFRDPWSRIRPGGWRVPNPVLRRASAWLERICLQASDRIVMVDSLAHVDDYFGRLPASVRRRVHSVPNGYDEEDFHDVRPDPALLKGEQFLVSYVGTIYDEETLRSLVEPFRVWHSRAPSELARVCFIHAGYAPAPLEAFAVPCRTLSLGFIPHRDAIRLRLSSHLQLFALPSSFKPHVMSGKIFEVLRAGAEVVAMVRPDSDPARLIHRLGCGTVISPGDHEAAAEALQRAYRRWEAGEAQAARPPPGIEEFSRERQAAELETMLRELAGHRTSGTIGGLEDGGASRSDRGSFGPSAPESATR